MIEDSGRRRRRKRQKEEAAGSAVFELRRTPFDLWMVLFLLSLVVSAWLSFAPRLAFVKFWMGLAAVVLFYGVTAVSRQRAWGVAAWGGPLAAFWALLFVALGKTGLSWAIISRVPVLGWWLVEVRRFWPLLLPHPNVLGGLIALFVPFGLAFGWVAWREKRRRWVWVTAVSLLLALAGLLLTRSVGAWLALALGLGVWWCWPVAEWLAVRLRLPRGWVYGLLLALLGLGAMGGVWLLVAFQLPGGDAFAQRWELAVGAGKLVQDFPLAGSGLATFAPLYAEYVRIVPNFFVGYSNFYLDLWLEMGPFGLLCVLAVWLGSGVRLGRSLKWGAAAEPAARSSLWLLRWATLASWVVAVVHGLLDDALFGGLGTPLLFVTPAMAVLVTRRKHQEGMGKWWKRRGLVWGLAGLLLLLVLGVVGQRPLRAQWAAAVGARTMDGYWLIRWPMDVWRTPQNTVLPEESVLLFEQALALEPGNRTARQRLAMMAWVERDWDTAVVHLQAAQAEDETHRGITKLLGYTYVWLGQLDEAERLLVTIPEAAREMEAYTNWWQRWEQPEQAAYAEEMRVRLGGVRREE